MPKIRYIARNFSEKSLKCIEQAVQVLEEYAKQGYYLTLRSLFYQFVTRVLIPNTQRAYKNLGSLINDARLAGLVDWNHLEDRTRNVEQNSHWDSPADMVASCADQFQIDKWRYQDIRVEVWIEKEALAGIFEDVCRRLDVAYLCCRGYTSQSEMWEGAMRLKKFISAGQRVLVLHFGDHDPSGIDMTRDIEQRLRLFLGSCESRFELRRIALTMPQIEQYGPPPNPAKETDSRHADYLSQYGNKSWELDALEPAVLVELVEREVEAIRDEDAWAKAVSEENEAKRRLQGAADHWDELVRIMEKRNWLPEGDIICGSE